MSGTLDALRTALADRYRIERELGAGAMATVYLAWGGAPRRLTRQPLLETSRRTWARVIATPPGDSVRVVNVVTSFHAPLRRKAAASTP